RCLCGRRQASEHLDSAVGWLTGSSARALPKSDGRPLRVGGPPPAARYRPGRHGRRPRRVQALNRSPRLRLALGPRDAHALCEARGMAKSIARKTPSSVVDVEPKILPASFSNDPERVASGSAQIETVIRPRVAVSKSCDSGARTG